VNSTAAPTAQRVLLALHGIEPASTLLSTAGALLHGAQAELAGLFVEDLQLLRLAALPFTREIGLASGMVRPLDVPDLERALRTQAEKVRQLLAQTAAALQVPWSFRVTRGRLLDEALIAAADADLVLIGQRRRAVQRSLGLREAQPAEPTVCAMFDATDAAFRALDVALQLARGHAESITLLLPAGSDADIKRLRQLAAKRLQVASHVPSVETLPVGALSGRLEYRRRRALVLATGSARAGRADLAMLVETADCPLVLVR